MRRHPQAARTRRVDDVRGRVAPRVQPAGPRPVRPGRGTTCPRVRGAEEARSAPSRRGRSRCCRTRRTGSSNCTPRGASRSKRRSGRRSGTDTRSSPRRRGRSDRPRPRERHSHDGRPGPSWGILPRGVRGEVPPREPGEQPRVRPRQRAARAEDRGHPRRRVRPGRGPRSAGRIAHHPHEGPGPATAPTKAGVRRDAADRHPLTRGTRTRHRARRGCFDHRVDEHECAGPLRGRAHPGVAGAGRGRCRPRSARPTGEGPPPDGSTSSARGRSERSVRRVRRSPRHSCRFSTRGTRSCGARRPWRWANSPAGTTRSGSTSKTPSFWTT